MALKDRLRALLAEDDETQTDAPVTEDATEEVAEDVVEEVAEEVVEEADAPAAEDATEEVSEEVAEEVAEEVVEEADVEDLSVTIREQAAIIESLRNLLAENGIDVDDASDAEDADEEEPAEDPSEDEVVEAFDADYAERQALLEKLSS